MFSLFFASVDVALSINLLKQSLDNLPVTSKMHDRIFTSYALMVATVIAAMYLSI